MDLLCIKDYMPRCHCMNNEWVLIWFFIAGNVIIGISYFAIPVVLLCWRKIFGKNLPITVGRHMLLFALFIIFCGGGHFLDAVMVWLPFYRLKALWDFLTAIISSLTAVSVIHILLNLKPRKKK